MTSSWIRKYILWNFNIFIIICNISKFKGSVLKIIIDKTSFSFPSTITLIAIILYWYSFPDDILFESVYIYEPDEESYFLILLFAISLHPLSYSAFQLNVTLDWLYDEVLS